MLFVGQGGCPESIRLHFVLAFFFKKKYPTAHKLRTSKAFGVLDKD